MSRRASSAAAGVMLAAVLCVAGCSVNPALRVSDTLAKGNPLLLDDVPFHTTDSIMRVERLPEHLIIVGGGFVAAELGHVFAALGSRVSVVHRGGRLLRHEDHEVSVRFTERFGRRVHLHLDA